ncbi:hypothetical protein FLR11_16655, partial [Listeria monocytogenes]|nr:hypothetical protein [Listeria monocytogenes]
MNYTKKSIIRFKAFLYIINSFYIPFVAFSLIDSLFSDILKWIEEAAKHIEGYIRLNRSGGKGVKVTNFLY